MDTSPEIIFALSSFTITARGLAALVIATPIAILLLFAGWRIIDKALALGGRSNAGRPSEPVALPREHSQAGTSSSPREIGSSKKLTCRKSLFV